MHRPRSLKAWRGRHSQNTFIPSSACRPGTDDTFRRLRELGDIYLSAMDTARDVSAEIDREVQAATAAGNSLTEISDASGLSVSQIEYILVAAGVQRGLADYSMTRFGESVIAYPQPRAVDPIHHTSSDAVATKRSAG